jgi:hypothetical protein
MRAYVPLGTAAGRPGGMTMPGAHDVREVEAIGRLLPVTDGSWPGALVDYYAGVTQCRLSGLGGSRRFLLSFVMTFLQGGRPMTSNRGAGFTTTPNRRFDPMSNVSVV